MLCWICGALIFCSVVSGLADTGFTVRQPLPCGLYFPLDLRPVHQQLRCVHVATSLARASYTIHRGKPVRRVHATTLGSSRAGLWGKLGTPGFVGEFTSDAACLSFFGNACAAKWDHGGGKMAHHCLLRDCFVGFHLLFSYRSARSDCGGEALLTAIAAGLHLTPI